MREGLLLHVTVFFVRQHDVNHNAHPQSQNLHVCLSFLGPPRGRRGRSSLLLAALVCGKRPPVTAPVPKRLARRHQPGQSPADQRTTMRFGSWFGYRGGARRNTWQPLTRAVYELMYVD